MKSQTKLQPKLDGLMAFYPGMQVLLGELVPGARSINSFFLVRDQLGFLPEVFNVQKWKVTNQHYALRPELLESCYFLHRGTRGVRGPKIVDGKTNATTTTTTTSWQWAADFALHAIETLTRTECGYGVINYVSPTTSGSMIPDFVHHHPNQQQKQRDRHGIELMDEMPSYFLSETIKYLYLTFDDNNILHRDLERQWVFTTEAHPIHHVPPAYYHDTQNSKNNNTTSDNSTDHLPEQLKDKTRNPILQQQEDIMKDQLVTLLEKRRNIKSEPDYDNNKKKNRTTLNLVIPFEHWKHKWAKQADARSYYNDMEKSQSEVVKGKTNRQIIFASMIQKSKTLSWSFTKLFTPLSLDKSRITDNGSYSNNDNIIIWDPIQQELNTTTNVASLVYYLRGKGGGINLSKTCPNTHHDKWQWIHTIGGFDLEYMDTFIPTANDDSNHATGFYHTEKESFSSAWMLTALTSSAFYDTDYFSSTHNDHIKKIKLCNLDHYWGDDSISQFLEI